MQEMKQQLEDLGVRRAAPEALRRDRPHGVDPHARARASTSPRCSSEVRERLAELRHRRPRSPGRPKHLWSIYEKMVVKGREFDEIFDLVGIRVIVDSVKDCYAALGSIHAHLEAGAGPVQGLHRDAEVQPLPVAAHDGDRAAGQAARGADPHPEMHQRAEFGVAAHWTLQGRTHRAATSPG